MAMHPQMSTIAPGVAGLGLAESTGIRFHMFANAYAQTVGCRSVHAPAFMITGWLTGASMTPCAHGSF